MRCPLCRAEFAPDLFRCPECGSTAGATATANRARKGFVISTLGLIGLVGGLFGLAGLGLYLVASDALPPEAVLAAGYPFLLGMVVPPEIVLGWMALGNSPIIIAALVGLPLGASFLALVLLLTVTLFGSAAGTLGRTLLTRPSAWAG